jgi:hypothetical protein
MSLSCALHLPVHQAPAAHLKYATYYSDRPDLFSFFPMDAHVDAM